jgi:hypothetical protein
MWQGCIDPKGNFLEILNLLKTIEFQLLGFEMKL